jgi:hypothetical protein
LKIHKVLILDRTAIGPQASRQRVEAFSLVESEQRSPAQILTSVDRAVTIAEAMAESPGKSFK